MKELVWHKSSHTVRDECVEVADTGGSAAIRDSKNPRGAQLRVKTRSWHSFLANLKAGGYDRP